MNKLKKFALKPIFIGGIAVVLLLSWYFYTNRDTGPTYETVTARIGAVMEEVSVTGNVKPAEEVALSFEKGGKVSGVYVKVGDKVYSGKSLVSLDQLELQTQLTQAETNLKVQEVRVENAKVNLEDTKKNIIDKIQDAYTKSDDAVRTKVDQFVEDPKSSDPQLKFYISNTTLEMKFESDRKITEQILMSWKSSLDAPVSYSNTVNYVNAAKVNLDQVRSLLEEAASVLNALVLTTYPTQSTINGWKADVSSARTNVAAATTNLLTAEEKLKTAESNLSLEETQILSSKAAIDNYKAQLNKTAIYSPINGIVTKQTAKVGEVVASNVSLISIISESKFEVETNVPEADIAKVKIGSRALITLDAYGDETVFEANVVAVDPAETVIEGVTTYKVTIQFVKDDNRIKSGMTANIDIQGRGQENVIVIPVQAVVTKNGNKIVKVLRGAEVQEIKVETGLRGTDGNVAILNGLSDGDEVILFEK